LNEKEIPATTMKGMTARMITASLHPLVKSNDPTANKCCKALEDHSKFETQSILNSFNISEELRLENGIKLNLPSKSFSNFSRFFRIVPCNFLRDGTLEIFVANRRSLCLRSNTQESCLNRKKPTEIKKRERKKSY